jgi:hypothetical protein
MAWYKSTGVITYDPKAKTIDSKPWWLILACCEDLARYYRETYNLFYRGSSRKLMKPAWGSHVSVIRGEEPANKDLWLFRQGETVEFEYDGELLSNDLYCWLPVRCETLLNLREQLGLPRNPIHSLHLTIGIEQNGVKQGA